jgi:hypothetical protein
VGGKPSRHHPAKAAENCQARITASRIWVRYRVRLSLEEVFTATCTALLKKKQEQNLDGRYRLVSK